MSIEVSSGAREKEAAPHDDKEADTSFIKLSEGTLYVPEGNGPDRTERLTERPAELDSVRERLELRKHEFDSLRDGRTPEAELLERNRESDPAEQVMEFIESLNFHRDHRSVDALKKKLANMPPDSAVDEALGQVRLGDTVFRERVFKNVATGGLAVGTVGMIAIGIDGIVGGSLLGASGVQLVADAMVGGSLVIAAAISLAGLMRGGLKIAHTFQQQRSRARADALLSNGAV